MRFFRPLVMLLVASLALVGVQFVGPATRADAAAFATAGLGKFKSDILWLTWGGGTNGVDGKALPNGTSTTASVDVGGERMNVTCTIGKIAPLSGTTVPTIYSYRPGSWVGDSMDNLYNIGGTGTANQLVNGIVVRQTGVSFDVTCVATIGPTGTERPFELPGMVIGDAESASSIEWMSGTADGTWSLIEAYRPAGCTAGYGVNQTNPSGTLQTLLLRGVSTACDSSGAPMGIGYLNYNPTAYQGTNRAVTSTWKMQGGGNTAMSIGIWAPTFDFGDAPTSYGFPAHALDTKVTADGVPTSANQTPNTDPFAPGFVLGQVQYNSPVTLGQSVDGEVVNRTGLGTAAQLDDVSGIDDEDGVTFTTGVAGTSQNVTVKTQTWNGYTGTSYLNLWIDFNGNGTFDAGEQIATDRPIAPGAVTTTVPYTVPAGVTNKPTYLRARVCTAAGDCVSPATAALNGEAEDHLITLPVPKIALSKTAVGPTTAKGTTTALVDPGDTIAYTFTVTNTGNVDLINAYISDPKCDAGTISPATAAIAVGAQKVFTCTRTLTQADVDAGTITNTAQVYGDYPGGTGTTPILAVPVTVKDTSTTTQTYTRTPQLKLTKTVGTVTTAQGASTGQTDGGDTVAYSFDVKNTGNLVVNNVSVTDPKCDAGSLSPAPLTLAPGASQTFTCTHTLTQAEVNSGSLVNTAAPTGTDPVTNTTPTVDPTSTLSATTTLTRKAQSEIIKSATTPRKAPANNNPNIVQAGDFIDYTFAVTNTGNVDLTSVAVSDPKCDATPVVQGGSATSVAVLSPAQTVIFTCTHTVTTADVTNQAAANTANVTATAPTGLTMTDAPTSQHATNTTIESRAEYKLVKTATGTSTSAGALSSVTDAGDKITYSFAITNTGNLDLANLSVADAKCDAGSLSPASVASLAVNASTTITCTHTLTQPDVDAGKVDNTASVVATATRASTTYTATMNPASDPTESTPITSAPSQTLDKTAGAPTAALGASPTLTDAGDTIAYTFKVTNTGNVTLSDVAITDALCDAGTLSPAAAAPLAPQATATFSCTHTITAAEFTAGTVDNSATSSGTPPTGAAVTASDKTSTPITHVSRVKLVKAAGSPTVDKGATTALTDAGDQITYTFTLTNTGNAPLTDVTITDARCDAAPAPVTSLAVNASTQVTCVHTITQDEMTAGVVNNSASVAATSALGTVTTDPASSTSTTTQLPNAPALLLVKSAGAPTTAAGAVSASTDAGDTITYSFALTNSGNQPLTGVTVTDALCASGTFNPASADLAVGASATITCSHTVTQAEMDAGKVDNTATAAGTSVRKDAVASAPSSVSSALSADPALSLVKTAGTPTTDQGVSATATDGGDTVGYAFKVTNTGNVTLTGVTLADAMCDALPAAITSLAPGASADLSCTHTLTQAEVNGAQPIVNTASVSGTTPGGVLAVSPAATAEVTVPADAVLVLTKSASPSAAVAVGDVVTYTFKATNTGNVTLTNVGVTDPMAGLSVLTCTTTPAGSTTGAAATNGSATLDPGGVLTCTATRTITQADIDKGAPITNDASVTGAPPARVTTPPTANASATVTPVDRSAAITLSKTPSATTGLTVGQVVTYTFVAMNTGNTTLTNATISDPMAGLSAIGDCTVQPASAGGTASAATGNGAQTLLPGESMTCTATRTITQDDLDAGAPIPNTATVTATPPTGVTAPTATQSATVTPAQAAPKLVIAKSVMGTPTKAGDQLVYTITVANTGNVTMSAPTVTDPLCTPSGPLADTGQAGKLDVGETWTYTCTYTVTQANVDAGKVDNTATASALAPGATTPTDAAPTTPGGNSTSTPITANPKLTFAKAATGTPTKAGDTIAYAITVNNTGNVTMSGVAVTDALCDAAPTVKGVTPAATSTTLAPGGQAVFECTHTVTQTEVNAGVVNNVATASGTAPGATSPTAAAPTASGADRTSTPIAAAPALTTEKSETTTAAPTKAGDVTSYSFKVTNAGNVTMFNVAVTDAQCTASAPTTTDATTLDPGAVAVFTCTHTVTQAEVDAGKVVNQATAAGFAPDPASPGNPSSTATTSPASKTVTSPIVAAPKLAIAKSNVTATAPTKAGDVTTYQLVVTNAGNVTMFGVGVTDAQCTASAPVIAGGSATTTTLAPGASATFACKHTVTQTEVDGGVVSNVATASGHQPDPAAPTGPSATVTTQASNQVDVPITPNPVLTIKKTATGTPSFAGDVINYTIAVANTGNVTLASPSVTDPTCAPHYTAGDTDGDGALDVAETWTYTCAYTVTQADVDAGLVVNTAAASATAPGATSPTQATPATPGAETVTTPIVPNPGLTIVKVAEGAPTAAGQPITFTITLTNTGNVTLSDVKVADPQCDATPVVLDAGGLPTAATSTTLTPRQVVKFLCTHATTQAEVDAGVVKNTAAASALAPGSTTPTPATPASPGSDSTATNVPALPAMTITKRVTGAPTKAGDTLDFAVTVTNTGNVTLSGVQMTDPMCSPWTPSGDGNANGTLDVQEIWVYTCTYTVTQADVDAGVAKNTAAASALAPGATSPTTAVAPLPGLDSTTTPIPAAPAMTLVKSAQGTPTKAGDPITYSFAVANTGNVTLSAPTVTDPLCTPTYAAGDANTNNKLDVGETWTLTCTYAVTQADVDAGKRDNAATVSALAPGATTPTSGQPASPGSNQTTTPIDASPKLTIVKAAAGAPTKAGDTIAYTFTATNTGNVTMSGVGIVDARCDATPVLLDASSAPTAATTTTLAPTAAAQFSCTHTVTQTEVNAGTVDNVASAVGSGPASVAQTSSDPAYPGADATSTPIKAAPGLTLAKTTASKPTKAGDVLTYTFTLVNTGNVSLSGVGVTDAKCAATPTVSDGSAPATATAIDLEPGVTVTFSCTHVATQDEVDAGKVVNTASAGATTPAGAAVVAAEATPGSSTVTTPVPANPALTITKSAAGLPSKAGESITYTFVVANTGNVSLSGVTVTDPLCTTTYVSGDADTNSLLGVSEQWTFQCSYPVTQADMDAGKVVNHASASGIAPRATAPTAATPANPGADTTTTQLTPAPALTIIKAATGSPVKAGDIVTYVFTVANIGNVTMSGITVTDPQCAATPVLIDASGAATTDTETRLSPNDVAKFTCTHAVTQAEVDAGKVDNQASASGLAPGATDKTISTPASPGSDSTSTPIGPAPALTVVKTAEGAPTKAGETIDYTVKVANTGNVTLSDVKPTDPLCELTLASGDGNADGLLDVTEVWVFSCTYTVTQADVDRGSVVNQAGASATAPGATEPTTATPASEGADTTETVVPRTAMLELTKSASSPTVDRGRRSTSVDAGADVIVYTFTLVNTGNVTISNAGVTDPMCDAGSLKAVDQATPITLAPGAKATFICTRTITIDDIAAGVVRNVAGISGDAPEGMTGAPTLDPKSQNQTLTALPKPLPKTDGSASLVGQLGYGFAVFGIVALLFVGRRRKAYVEMRATRD